MFHSEPDIFIFLGFETTNRMCSHLLFVIFLLPFNQWQTDLTFTDKSPASFLVFSFLSSISNFSVSGLIGNLLLVILAQSSQL